MREMLLFMERISAPKPLKASKFRVEGHTPQELAFNAALLLDMGYVVATPVKCCENSYTDYLMERITASGFSYLEAVRDDGVWRKTMSKIKSTVGSAPMEVVKETAIAVVKSMLNT
jgi:hypothetical protein